MITRLHPKCKPSAPQEKKNLLSKGSAKPGSKTLKHEPYLNLPRKPTFLSAFMINPSLGCRGTLQKGSFWEPKVKHNGAGLISALSCRRCIVGCGAGAAGARGSICLWRCLLGFLILIPETPRPRNPNTPCTPKPPQPLNPSTP